MRLRVRFRNDPRRFFLFASLLVLGMLFWLLPVVPQIVPVPQTNTPSTHPSPGLFTPVFAAGPSIVQQKCGTGTRANLGTLSVTFNGAVTVGNDLIAVATVQGGANTVINNVNVTDNVNSGHYKQWIRTLDQGNTLFVGTYSMNSTAAGTPAVSMTFSNTAPNSQSLQLCAYEVSGLNGAHYTAYSSTQGGGSASITIGTTGGITFSGDAGNAGGGALTCTCTGDSLNGNQAVGHGTGTWSGLSSVTYNEEADTSFTPAPSNYVTNFCYSYTVSTVNAFSTVCKVLRNGDDVLIPFAFYLKGGTIGAGLTLTTVPAFAHTCTVGVNNVNTSVGLYAGVMQCLSENAGSYNLTMTSTSNACGGASPCGIFATYFYELNGSQFKFAYTNGLSNALASSHSANSLTVNSSTFAIGVQAGDETGPPTVNGGYQPFACPQYTLGVYWFSCSEFQSFGSSGTTNFPVVWAAGAGTQAISEGVAVYAQSAVASSCSDVATVSGTGNTGVWCILNAISGDRILALLGTGSNTAQTFSFGTPADTVSSSFSTAVSLTTDYAKFGASIIFNGTAASSNSADNVSSSCGITAGGGGTGTCAMFVYEVPNINAPMLTGKGSCRNTVSTNCALNLNSTITSTSSYFVASVAAVQLSPQLVLGAGSGFTLDPASNVYGSGTFFGVGAEWTATGPSGTTNVPFTASSGGPTAQTWAQAAIGVQVSGPPPVSQALTCTMFQPGPQASLTLGGSGNPSPTSLNCDGNPHTVSATGSTGATFVQVVSNSTGASTASSINAKITGVHSGDTLVVGAVSVSSLGTTAITGPGLGCISQQTNTLSSLQVVISACPNTGSGTFTLTASCQFTSPPCGFFGIWVYEFSGHAYTFYVSNGTNRNPGSTTPQTNPVGFPGIAYLIGFDSINTIAGTTQSAGSGFTLGRCVNDSSINFGCTETQVGATGTTRFPFTISRSSAWSDEGVAVIGPPNVITISEPAGTSSNRYLFFAGAGSGGASQISDNLCASGTCSAFSFTNYYEDNVSVAWTPPTQCALCGPQVPIFQNSQQGAVLATPLTPTDGTLNTRPAIWRWVDNNTAWTTASPFFFNLLNYQPNATSGTILKTQHLLLTYSIQSGSIGSGFGQGPSLSCFTDQIQDFIHGNWLCGSAMTYGNLISVAWLFGLIAMEIPGIIYLKNGNVGLTLLILVAVFGLFGVGAGNTVGNFLPGALQTLGIAVATIGIAGIIYKIYAGRAQ